MPHNKSYAAGRGRTAPLMQGVTDWLKWARLKTTRVANPLDFPREQIDGIDISTEMLRISEEKQH